MACLIVDRLTARVSDHNNEEVCLASVYVIGSSWWVYESS